MLVWYHGQVVRQGSAKPSFPGSNPGGTSKNILLEEVLPMWRNGRRKGLKIPRGQLRAGSSPAIGTKVNRYTLDF